MHYRFAGVAAAALIVLAVVACSPTAASSSASAAPSAAPVATSFADYQTAFCSSFTSLIRAVGNPDANTPSVMSKQLDDAVKAGNVAAAQRAAAAITAELETGRRQAAIAAGWQPGVPSSTALDRVLLAFEANIAARAATAAPGASADPQAAFEHAGGVQAWTALLSSLSTIPVPAGATPAPCKAFTGSI